MAYGNAGASAATSVPQPPRGEPQNGAEALLFKLQDANTFANGILDRLRRVKGRAFGGSPEDGGQAKLRPVGAGTLSAIDEQLSNLTEILDGMRLATDEIDKVI